ncbi:MAG TPA: hypothetical protein PK970_00720 [Hyphomicrobiaceae bacterium]|nr:hypothetical protein [Hyphomicrobiaceae bacterium]
MADNKTRPTVVSVEAFLDSVPAAGKHANTLLQIDMMRDTISEKLVMWYP